MQDAVPFAVHQFVPRAVADEAPIAAIRGFMAACDFQLESVRGVQVTPWEYVCAQPMTIEADGQTVRLFHEVNSMPVPEGVMLLAKLHGDPHGPRPRAARRDPPRASVPHLRRHLLMNLDNAPDEVTLVQRRQAVRTRRPAIAIKNGRTRCPECLARLAYTDWENPEKVIREHRETDCATPVVVKARTRSRGVGRPRRLR